MIKNIFKILLLSSVVYAQTFIQGGQLHTPSITSASGSITFNGVQLNNLLNPTHLQDAATDNWVTTNFEPIGSAPGFPVTPNGSLFGSGTMSIGSTAAGTTGQSLIATTGSAPSWGIPVTAGNITATSNSSLTTLSSLTLPTTQLSGYLQGAQFPALTGDVTTTSGSVNTTLATVNSNTGVFGSSSLVPFLTLNGKGLVTAASSGQLSLTTGATGTLQAGQFPALTGDVTTSAGSLATTLATVNGLSGVVGSSSLVPFLTINGKGLVTNVSSGQLSLTSGVTGVLPIAKGGTNNGSLSVTSGTVYYGNNTAITGLAPGTSGQVFTTQGAGFPPIWAAGGGGTGLTSIAAYSTLSNNTNATALPIANQNLLLGTPGFSDTGIGYQITGITNGYFQGILQNTSSGTAASTDFIVSNNSGTATTYYGDLGINSSTFTGTGSLNLPNATYLYSQTGDLTLATNTANSMHFLTSGAITDAMTINSAGVISLPQLSSGVIPFINTSNQITTVSQGTSGQVLLSQGSSTPTWSSTAQATIQPTVQKFLTNGTQTGVVFYVTSANATVGAVYSNNTYVFTVTQTISGGTVLYTSCNSSAAPLASGTLSRFSGSGDSTITFTSEQSLATYMTPTNPSPLFITVEMVGGGGGGGTNTTSVAGTNGGNSLFGLSLLTANGGVLGINNASAVNNGGTASLGSGPIGIALTGGDGAVGAYTAYAIGGQGGSTPFGAGGSAGNGAATPSGNNAQNNTGTGGGGGGVGSGSQVGGGQGGGAGGYVKAIINSPSSSYYYSVGAAGTGTTPSAGGQGGNGGTGLVIVTEYYGSLGPAVSAAPQYAQAYFGSASSWSTTSSTFVDPTNSGGNALTVRKSQGIALTAAGSSNPGITFTPASANAVYQIIASFGAYNNNAGGAAAFQLTDGTTSIAVSGTESPGVAGGESNTSMAGVYIPGTTSPVTVKLQALAFSGTGTTIITGNSPGITIEWTVTRIDSLAITGTPTGITRSINNISTPQTLGNTALTDYVYNVTGNTSVTMPTAVSNLDDYRIKNTGSGTISILTTSAQTIDGSSTVTLPVQNTSLDLISDGSNWRVH